MNKPTVYQVPASTSNYSTASYPKKGIVLHWIVGTLASADATFQNPQRKASTQYGIGANGRIHQYVDDKYTAWHAGVLEYNRYYFGIEHEGGQLVNGQRIKPSPECHQASARLVAWLCKTYNIPCNRKSIIRHKETGYATECSGSLDIDWIVAEANKLLNPNTMFDYELYVKDNNLFMRIKSGSINEKVTVRNLTKGTSWEVFANKSVGNDGGAINTGMEACLYEVIAKGVVKQYDNRPIPGDPCKDVKEQLSKTQSDLNVANTTIKEKNAEITALKKLTTELEAKLKGETAEVARLNKELEAKDVIIKAQLTKILKQEQEINNQLPKIEELEAEVADLNGQLETLRTEYQKLAEGYEKLVQNCKGNAEDYKRLIKRLLGIIEALIARSRRGIISLVSRLRNGKR